MACALKSSYRILLILSLVVYSGYAASGANTPSASAVASAHPLATQAGQEILAAGGNAFDAAIAVTATLAVVEPSGSGLGGGGFWLLHRAKNGLEDGLDIMIDGRETAPAAATHDMFLDKAGNFVSKLSLDTTLGAGIPGVPAALDHIAKRYGKLSLKQSLAPAIRYAEQGFKITKHYQRLATMRHKVLLRSPAAKIVFLDDGKVPALGYNLRQRDLATTLRLLARSGRAGFYEGKFGKLLVSAVRETGGIWTLKDLKNYRVIERQPVITTYKNFKVVSAALPSSGGIVMIEALNLLEPYKLNKLPKWQRDHMVIEAMRIAYRDRALYLGDADFISVDTKKLISKTYADELRKEINTTTAGHGNESTVKPRARGQDTSHFSIIDQQGNRVAATLSINYPFGSGFMPPGTGVVLNNEMDDFSAKPGTPNVYGLVGSHANAIAPGKRPLSSMSPTFIESDELVVAMGTPGGSRIISMVLLALLEITEGRGAVKDWVSLPRFHHQYLPAQVTYEAGAFSKKELKQLQKADHKLKVSKSRYGNMQAVSWQKHKNIVQAASDPRGEGLASVKKH